MAESAPINDEVYPLGELRASLSKQISRAAAQAQILNEANAELQDSARRRVEQEYAQATYHLSGVINRNASLPTNVSSVRFLGAFNTRPSFLEKVVSPLVRPIEPSTLASSLEDIQSACNRLAAFGIFQDIGVSLDRAQSALASGNDLDVTIFLKERPRVIAKTGTDFGNAEAGAYGNIAVRNAFGGAENVSANIATGTKTRTALEATFDTPINASTNHRFELTGFNVSRNNQAYASHDEIFRGMTAKIKSLTSFGVHEIGVSSIWRQITSVSASASDSIRRAAGDNFKSSITHSFTSDTRDEIAVPSSGYLLRISQELAGLGLGGDTSFYKIAVDGQKAFCLSNDRRSTFSLSTRGGFLWSLDDKGSKISDRFFLGGPSNLRGFHFNSLGPRDGNDFLGGDAFLAATANALFPIPSARPDLPLRLQGFVTGGSLMPLNQENPQETVNAMLNQPSVSFGIGLVYRHSFGAASAARFELNFCLPLTARISDRARKGFQFAVALEFL